MSWLIVIASYVAVMAVAMVITRGAVRLNVPAGVVVVAIGLAVGGTGFGVVSSDWLRGLLPAVTVHLSFVIGALGVALGRGLLRLPLAEVLKRLIPPLALGVFALLLSIALLPKLIPELYPDRSFRRFLLPLATVLAAFPLLALRDLRGRPPADVGNVFLVAILIVGAVVSFAPPFLWTSDIDLGMVWRGPVLILGESGAVGVASAVLFLFLTRRLRLPRLIVGSVIFAGVLWFTHGLHLWGPFAGLGFGAALGRAGEPEMPLPFASRGFPFSAMPFALLAGVAFAPTLWWNSLVWPSVLYALYLVVLVLGLRHRVADGKHLATGPGVLFLGLALAMRLDGRMGPLSRVVLDFALPAWLAVRAALTLTRKLESRRTRVAPPG